MKYFYKDPLAAAWMAKHYGIQFCNGNFILRLTDVIDGKYEPVDFVIHRNSVALLDKFSDGQRQALGILGLWPESEAA